MATHAFKRQEKLSTGSLFLDRMLGGGLPLGRISSIYGNPDAGKTTLCLLLAKQALAKGLRVLFVHTEGKMDYRYFYLSMGIDPDSVDDKSYETLLPVINNDFDAVQRIIHYALAEDKYDFIVLDTLSHMIPIEKLADVDAGAYGGITKTVNHLYRSWTQMLTAEGRSQHATMVVVSQVRVDMSGANPNYVSYKKAIADHATNFVAALDLYMTRISKARTITESESSNERVGYKMAIEVKKAQISGIRAGASCEPVVRISDEGYAIFDYIEEMYEVLVEKEILVNKDGKKVTGRNITCHYNGENLGNYRTLRQRLIENEALCNELYNLAKQ